MLLAIHIPYSSVITFLRTYTVYLSVFVIHHSFKKRLAHSRFSLFGDFLKSNQRLDAYFLFFSVLKNLMFLFRIFQVHQ